jgi:[glutamine synthetase] adenylyltransferase / [glutamine synthetase]-adenylyl-L-tyrosine phosphorylase
MDFASNITRFPIPHDAAAGASIAGLFSDSDLKLQSLLSGAAGCSPYLQSLIIAEMEWLQKILTMGPGAAIAEIFDPLAGLSSDQLAPALRQAKRRVALIVALADLGGLWQLENVTKALTDFADLAVNLCVTALVGDEIKRGKLPGAMPDDAVTGAGMVVLAMGKMGAGELNYSSDIDLICLFDETRYVGAEQEARAAFIRVTRRMTAILSDTAGGYVFRVDLRLRPDAAVTPVCLSMAAAESYYESVGRTWERAAYIKARPCAGDLVAGARFLKTLIPFVWRKHLDFAAIQDAHDMRLRIRDHRRLHGPVVGEGHNLKLGVGGIREIEFFTQTRQLIAGGRDPDLRDCTTVGGLRVLAEKGWIAATVADELTQHYRAHRELEHRLQMVNDAQTHEMPTTEDAFSRIAHFMGKADVAEFRADLKMRLERVDQLTTEFFAPSAAEDGPELSDAARAIVAGWANYPALRSERAITIFQRLRPMLLKRLMRAGNPDEALVALDGFLAGLPAGVQIFSLFDANPQLVDLIVDIAATSPALSRYLSRNSGVLDAVIGGSFFSDWPASSGIATALEKRMAAEGDYERRLDGARRFMKEWHFRIGVHHLRGLIDAFEAGRQYADLACGIIKAIWPVVCQEFARKHGPVLGHGAVILGMGSLGAERLNAESDLDLIVIYDPAEAEISTGPRPLAARPYFARLTQALVTALSAPTAEGRLYEVDMRLRPSGRQGPVATSFAAFQTYQETEAWTWEHLALTRARVVAGDLGLAARVEDFRVRLLLQKGPGAAVRADVAEMRQKLAVAKPADGPLDAKFGPGKLMDIELLAQTCALITASASFSVDAQLAAGVDGSILSVSDQMILLNSYSLCWSLQAATRLLQDHDLTLDHLAQGGRAFVLRETGMQDGAALLSQLDTKTKQAALVVADVLGEKPSVVMKKDALNADR